MGLHKTLCKRDLYPLKEASKIAHTLTNSERYTARSLRWSYIMMADRKQPDLAAVAVYDEHDKFVGWWYR
jgi:hypothetical protein